MDANKTFLPNKVNWKQVGLFIGLTIALSWLLNLVLFTRFGYYSQYTTIFLQLEMFIPAFVAIALQRYAFKGSPIYYRTYRERPRWFFTFYLLLTLVIVALVGLITFQPDLYPAPIASLASLLWIISLVVLVTVRFASGKEAFQRAGLSGGKWYAWLLVWIGIMAYLVVQVLLNIAFHLGKSPDLAQIAASAGMDLSSFVMLGSISMLLLNPLQGLVIAFGEEYGWRGYLQGELVKLGKVKGTILVGVVWGVWHAPAIAMGHNYPGHPVLGPIAFLFFNIFLSIFLGYIVLKTGSVWLAAFGHAILNSAYSWLIIIVNTPNDPLFAFGPGIYGIVFAFILALVVLRDPVWKKDGMTVKESMGWLNMQSTQNT